jgi:hypothetical protein
MNTLHIKIVPGFTNTHQNYDSGILITRDDDGNSGTFAGDLLGSIAFDSEDPHYDQTSNFKAGAGMFGLANETHDSNNNHGAFLTFRTKKKTTDESSDSQETLFIGPNHNSALGVSLGVSGSISASGDLYADLDSATTSNIVYYNTGTGKMTQGAIPVSGYVVRADKSGGFTDFGSGFSGTPNVNVFGGTFIETTRSSDDITVNFKPGGATNGLITSDGSGGGATVESGLTFDGTLRCAGDIVAFFSSDKRLKDNIIPIGSPLKKLMQIGGYEFDWNKKQDTYEGHDVGVIAQEVEEILPEAVTTREDGYKAVKYEKLVPLLIESVKEQQKQIDDLKELVNKLTK